MKRINLIYVMALLLLAACQQRVDTSQPPPIRYGEDTCNRCNMIISDERFAAAYWTVDGVAHRFDDIGEMLTFYHENRDEVASFWVHDVNTGEWLAATKAYLVLDPALETPMGFGVAALAEKTAADALAGGHADAVVLDFPALLAQVQSGAITLSPMQNQSPNMDNMNGMTPDEMPGGAMPAAGNGG